MKTLKLSETEIDRAVKKAIARIPAEIRHHLKNIVISFQKRPSKEIRAEMGLDRHETLLGVYRGTSLQERRFIRPFTRTPSSCSRSLSKKCVTQWTNLRNK